MSEKRKPEIKIVASKRGKKVRVWLYPAELWANSRKTLSWGQKSSKRYRVRINGKWVHGDKSFTLSKVMADLRMWIAGFRRRVRRSDVSDQGDV